MATVRHTLDPRERNNKQLSPNVAFDYAFYGIVQELKEKKIEFTVEPIEPEKEQHPESNAKVFENGVYGARFTFQGKSLVLLSAGSDAKTERERNQGTAYLPKILRRVEQLQQQELKSQHDADHKAAAPTQYVIPLAEARGKFRRHWVQLRIIGKDSYLNDPKVKSDSLKYIWDYPLDPIKEFIKRGGFQEFKNESYLNLQSIWDFNYCAFYVAFATRNLVRTMIGQPVYTIKPDAAYFEKDFREFCQQCYVAQPERERKDSGASLQVIDFYDDVDDVEQDKSKCDLVEYQQCIRDNALIKQVREGGLEITPFRDLEIDDEPWEFLELTEGELESYKRMCQQEEQEEKEKEVQVVVKKSTKVQPKRPEIEAKSQVLAVSPQYSTYTPRRAMSPSVSFNPIEKGALIGLLIMFCIAIFFPQCSLMQAMAASIASKASCSLVVAGDYAISVVTLIGGLLGGLAGSVVMGIDAYFPNVSSSLRDAFCPGCGTREICAWLRCSPSPPTPQLSPSPPRRSKSQKRRDPEPQPALKAHPTKPIDVPFRLRY